MTAVARILLVSVISVLCNGAAEEGDIFISLRDVRSEFPEGIDLDQLTSVRGLTDRNAVVGVCVLSDEELQVLLRSVAQRKGADLASAPGVIVPFRAEGKLDLEEASWTVKPRAVKDGRMIDMEISLSVDEEETSAFRVVVPDGSNVMCRIDGFGVREWCAIIQASLMEPTEEKLSDKESPYLKHLVREGDIPGDIAKYYGFDLNELGASDVRGDQVPEEGSFLKIPIHKPKWDLPYKNPGLKPD